MRLAILKSCLSSAPHCLWISNSRVHFHFLNLKQSLNDQPLCFFEVKEVFIMCWFLGGFEHIS